MRYSCSSRLDWEYSTRRRFNWVTFFIFLIGGAAAVLFAAFAWMGATGDPFATSLYWAIQTTTAVGYGMDFSGWTWVEHTMCIVWMCTSALYWACLLAVVTARVSDHFRR